MKEQTGKCFEWCSLVYIVKMLLGILSRWNEISCLIIYKGTGCEFSKAKKALGRGPGILLSVPLWIPISFHAQLLWKLQGRAHSPWRRVRMALISAWFLSSSATLALASDKLSSSFRTWASAFSCSGRMNLVEKCSLLPPGLLLSVSFSCPGYLPSTQRSLSQKPHFYQMEIENCHFLPT